MSFIPPADNPRIRLVSSLEELVTYQFANGVNALCWPRELPGDFGEIVAKLAVGPGITTVEADILRGLHLSPAGELARQRLLEDQRSLREFGLAPVLDCINGYLPKEDRGLFRTDVCSFHADSATDEADTYLCTYFGESSIGIHNDDVVQKVLVPEIRAILLRDYGGEDDEGFLDYLAEHFYDLHYQPAPNARTYSFGIGNLWRVAIDYPGNPVPPCIHRAPDPIPGNPPRLLLIS